MNDQKSVNSIIPSLGNFSSKDGMIAIKEGTIVYVETVAQNKKQKIMYRVLNQ